MKTQAQDIRMRIKRKFRFDERWYEKEDRNKWILPLILRERAEKLGDRPYLQFEYDTPLSFAKVNLLANRVANALRKLGVEKGDRVGVFMLNCAEYVFIWYGILKAGAIMAPVNTAYKGDFLQYMIDHPDSKVLFVSEELLDRLVPLEEAIPQLKHIVVLPGEGKAGFENPGIRTKPLIPFAEFLESGTEDEPQVEWKSIDIARLMYTSGTTGRAKGCTKSHAADYYTGKGFINIMGITEEDILFTCLPLFHSNAQVVCTYPALLAGAKVVIHKRFSATGFWKWIKESDTTVFNLLGAMSYFLWKQPPTPEEKEHRVRVACVAPSPHDILEEFMERFNLKIIEGYGLTETGNVAFMRPNKPFRVGSCGLESPGYEVKIVDPETDEELPRGELGEIVARPRIPNIMLYYYHKMPEKTVEDFRNFWFHTGDAGRMDEDGYIYFVDRVKDYIRRRGENISSFELEKVVGGHPDIAESAAIGVKTEEGKYAEDEVMIVVVRKPESRLTSEELMRWCEERMPYFMIPRFVRFRDSLPKTQTERVQKHKLREEGITPDTWDREKAGYQIKR